MKKSLVLAMAMALGISATAFAANPFSDVPAGHWAYASVAKLAAAGIVDGYPDGTFKGDNLMTRYEMAQIVAKAYAKSGIGADDKLMAEFADELDNLGVRAAKLEKKADNVKITGEVRVGFKHVENSDAPYSHSDLLRTRLYLHGAINDNWTYGAMLENTQNCETTAEENTTSFRRAFVKGNIGGATVTAGRQAFTIGQGYVADLTGDAVKVDFGNKLKTTLFAGRFDSVVYGTLNRAEWIDNDIYYNDKANLYGIILNYSFSDKLHAEGGFYAQEGNDPVAAIGNPHGIEEQRIYTLGIGYKFDKNIRFYGEYQKADKDWHEVITGIDSHLLGDDGWAATLTYKGADPAQKNSWGAYVTYYDQSGAVVLDSLCELEDNLTHPALGMKGYEIGIGYTVFRNIVAKLTYCDLENADKYMDTSANLFWGTVTCTF
ncbi:MAG: S-layer homology domain-containing protein [Clostridia bacterium]|nr:S-layer homology domain-containing protein [Clostridia bacterium]